MYALVTLLAALPCVLSLVTRQAGTVDFFNPNDNGGSMLDNGKILQLLLNFFRDLFVLVAGDGFGEPLNVSSYLSFLHSTHLTYFDLQVIISGLSSPGVLTEAGFENFANAIGL